MKVLHRVHIQTRYTRREILRFASSSERRELLRLARKLRGLRVVHVNATSSGGGVAVIMQSLMPYLRALGLNCEWYNINPRAVSPAFFTMTNRLHNALQGVPTRFSAADWKRYERVNHQIADVLNRVPYDALVIHDPQPLGSVRWLRRNQPRIYISHIDTSHPQLPAWRRLFPKLRKFDQLIFSHPTFAHSDLPVSRLRIVPPAIDPLSLKQKIVSVARARRYLARYKIPLRGPLVAQVSRFDIWKNPLGVIAAHHLARQAVPKLQTVLVGLKEAKDNPQADRIYQDIVRVAEKHQSLHVFFHPWGIKNIPEFTMLVQNAADVIVQNSTREGFGLTVAEAMWKGKPVIGGPAAGIRRQIRSGHNGLIAKNSQSLAAAIIGLLRNSALRRRLGKAAKTSVRKRFLMHRYALDHLRLYHGLKDGSK